MNYFDLHCDTMAELYRRSVCLDRNECHVSLEKADRAIDHYAQFFAFFASKRLTDAEGFERYLKTYEYFTRELEKCSDKIVLCRNFAELEAAKKSNRVAAFHAVEDIRIIDGDVGRIDTLYGMGVRYVTPVWGGVSSIGGAHQTGEGLTDLGKRAVRRLFELGIVPDVSHSSERTADEIIELAEEYGKPFIASHSNSYSVYSHTRNLRDRHFEKLKKCGGIVGISLCDIHLCPESEGKPDIDTVIRHIDRYLELGGEDCLSFGCDLDGCDLAKGVSDISDMPKIFERMSDLGYSDEIIEKISYKNAYNFIKRNF